MKGIVFLLLIILLAPMLSLHAADAKVNWDANCVPCHGKEGKADTAMGKALKAKNLTDPKVQAEFSDAKASESIRNGVKEKGKITMRAFGDKLSEDEIKALVGYVRTLKR
jgi:mono/diheme cytochrome c family protein